MSDERLESYWTDSEPIPGYPALNRDIEVDVAVVGAGITGLTAAYLLKQAGRRVAVLDRDRIGGVDSMAHHGARDLRDRSAWPSSSNTSGATTHRLPGTPASPRSTRSTPSSATKASTATGRGCGLQARAARRRVARTTSARRFGRRRRWPTSWASTPRSSTTCRSSACRASSSSGQARIHPGKYLRAPRRAIDGDGSHVFEQTRADEVTDEPLSVKAGHTIACQRHRPRHAHAADGQDEPGERDAAADEALSLHVVCRRRDACQGTVPDPLFWDTADPYHYLRSIEPRRSRLRHLRRRRSQDRPGRGHRALLRAARGRRCERLPGSRSRIAGRAR